MRPSLHSSREGLHPLACFAARGGLPRVVCPRGWDPAIRAGAAVGLSLVMNGWAPGDVSRAVLARVVELRPDQLVAALGCDADEARALQSSALSLLTPAAA